MRFAVSSSGGSSSVATASRDARLACAETLTAATIRPPPSRTGAAIERSPSSSSWSTSAQPCSRISSSSSCRSCGFAIARGGERADVGAGEVGVELVVGECREQDPAHRGRVGREAGADVDRDAHDPAGGDAADVDDVVAVEHGHRARFADLGGEPLEVRLGDLGQAQAREVRVAELEDARGQRELLAVGADVAEVGQREQEAARGGAREAGAAGDVAQRELGVVGAERADDGEAALERLDEVVAPVGHSSSVLWAIATALLAAGTPA